ncbi:MAG: hypothetical protein ABI594_14805 [Ginsengibacter sp.]
MNNQFTVSEQKPVSLYFKDFDGNGTIDPFMFYFNGDTSYPAYSRDDVAQQMPMLNKKYLFYPDYAGASLNSMFTQEQIKDVGKLQANQMQTIYLDNTGKEFTMRPLQVEAQYAPVCAITSADINNDGKKDIILAGNNLSTRIKFSRYDANHAILMLGDGKGNFTYVPQWQSGLDVQGSVRGLVADKKRLFFGVNDGKVVEYSWH